MSNDPCEDDAAPALVARWRYIERIAIAICMTGIGSFTSGQCVCARDVRRPSRSVPRCQECLAAATAALLVAPDDGPLVASPTADVPPQE